jgi:uncharacterized protein (DUF885 family)
MHLRQGLALSIALTLFFETASAQVPAKTEPASYAENELRDLGSDRSEMRPYIERFDQDRGALLRKYPILMSETRRHRLTEFYHDWRDRLSRMDFDKLNAEDRVDYLLFANFLDHELRQMDLDAKALKEAAPLLPFAETILALDQSCRRMETADGQKAAAALDSIQKQITAERKNIEERLKTAAPDRNAGLRAAMAITNLEATLKHWFTFYNGYDPLFTWWAGDSFKTVDAALKDYQRFLREKVAGAKPGEDATVSPIGREGLLSELAFEMIPYTPEELIAIANKEFAWCEHEMKRASRDLGYGDDWKKALEHVKTLYVPPGKQPELIRQLAVEAEKFLDDHDLITIPNLARETWRMEMMSPERQLVNPFFTGGEVISVSYPTNTMTDEQKLMSMRGNNIHFARATVFHELIPGHHLQGFMNRRYRPYRRIFSTPFSVEGWALYWELLMWDLNFPQSAENRIGMLFWRMHRCARIIFSLSFHLGKMTPEECIDFLVNRVGHERDNAAGEVRRSFNGSYSPLYQAAYLLGGLQIYALHRELVGSGKMTNRQFHDAFLHEGRIPIEMVRAIFTNQRLTRDFRSSWRFYGAAPAN